MLTAKLGDSIINLIDTPYDRYRLKQWSNKKLFKCPVCAGEYEYCHGDVISPYFRHVGKECEGYYSESETDEHRKGKELLYNWLTNQSGVVNIQLEAWIPETKQRPDIYFEYNNKKYVIEFQCTPIASEYLARRELYRLNGIKDIWILGKSKYNFYTPRLKTIEKNPNLIYLDVNTPKLYVEQNSLCEQEHILSFSEDWYRNSFVYFEEDEALSVRIKNLKFNMYTNSLNNFSFKGFGFIGINDTIINKYKELDSIQKEKNLKEFELINEMKNKEENLKEVIEGDAKYAIIKDTIDVVIENIKEEFKSYSDISIIRKNNYPKEYYLFYVELKVWKEVNRLYIKEKSVDVCTDYNYNLKSVVLNEESYYEDIKSAFKEVVNNLLEHNKQLMNRKKERKEKIDNKLGEFSNKKILLFRSGSFRTNKRFLYLKDFELLDDYMLETVSNKFKVLNNKGIDTFLIMLPKKIIKSTYNLFYHSYASDNYLINFFKNYGFTNIEFVYREEDI